MGAQYLSKMISREVKRAVSDSGLSVREAARKMGVGHETVYRWMRGENLPPLDKLARLAETLGQPISLRLGANGKAALPDWAERLEDRLTEQITENRRLILEALAHALADAQSAELRRQVADAQAHEAPDPPPLSAEPKRAR